MNPPQIIPEDFNQTRDYIREVTLIMSALQRGFIATDPDGLHYGLAVGMRGLITQPLKINRTEQRALLDLHRHKLRLGTTNWSLEEYAAPELLNNVKVWLAGQGSNQDIRWPHFEPAGRSFDTRQATVYAEALWWLHAQFQIFTAGSAPAMLYPQQFNLSAAAVGWSTGDQLTPEPYIYAGDQRLLYAALVAAADPAQVLQTFLQATS